MCGEAALIPAKIFLGREDAVFDDEMLFANDMTNSPIRSFHAHIYYNADEVDQAKRLAADARSRFPIAVGHFHLGPVGPHPRGSCQLTAPTEPVWEFRTVAYAQPRLTNDLCPCRNRR